MPRHFHLPRPPVRLGRHSTPFIARVGVQVIRVLGRLVLGDQVRDHLPRLVELVQVLREGRRLLVRLDEGVPLAHAVVLLDYPLEELFCSGTLANEHVGGREREERDIYIKRTVAMLV